MEMQLRFWVLERVESDPLLASVKRTEAKVAALLAGYFSDGESQLRDAANADSPDESRRLVNLAIESFRSAFSRTDSPLAAAYVASCYMASGQETNGALWAEKTWRDIERQHASLTENLDEDHIAESLASITLMVSGIGLPAAVYLTEKRRKKAEVDIDLLVDVERAARLLTELAANTKLQDAPPLAYCFGPGLYAWKWSHRGRGKRRWREVEAVDIQGNSVKILRNLHQFRHSG